MLEITPVPLKVFTFSVCFGTLSIVWYVGGPVV